MSLSMRVSCDFTDRVFAHYIARTLKVIEPPANSQIEPTIVATDPVLAMMRHTARSHGLSLHFWNVRAPQQPHSAFRERGATVNVNVTRQGDNWTITSVRPS